MDYIRKLPLLMSLTCALIVGTVGYTHKVQDKENTLKVLIAMIIFYIVGYMIRDTVLSVLDTVKKKDVESKQKAKQLEKEKREEESERQKKADRDKGKFLDFKANDEGSFNTDEEGFNALPVADFIKKELNR